ncbi:hypothetical protein RRG08_028676 [Elysia crispata]|uniref:Uncharacterized protein n=1 Tax=Elysia crispata TaxID=231223 RepID=A0AAE1DEK1_9GAST|nr:hypothetical protein RRG08_028676 [Elysia crispata]
MKQRQSSKNRKSINSFHEITHANRSDGGIDFTKTLPRLSGQRDSRTKEDAFRTTKATGVKYKHILGLNFNSPMIQEVLKEENISQTREFIAVVDLWNAASTSAGISSSSSTGSAVAFVMQPTSLKPALHLLLGHLSRQRAY